MRSPNVAGRSYSLMIWTPIRPGEQDALRAYLEGLGEGDSPLAKLPRTHMARWIVVPDMPVAPGTDLRDPLGSHFLLFTANLDGDVTRTCTSSSSRSRSRRRRSGAAASAVRSLPRARR